jgi:glycosyl transferase family 87
LAAAEGAANLKWYRLAALGLSTVFVLCGIAAVALVHRHILAPDFLSFWAAGHLVVNGDAASAYDTARHHAVEVRALPKAAFLPFGYPPPFLLVLLPFGMLPFLIAFVLWVAITAALYAAATRRLVDPRFAFAQAAAAANFIIGQNGFLIAAIFIRGSELLATRPLLAGAILGLLVIKPQLAILAPVALLAGREWRAVLGGLLMSFALLALSLILFGSGAYRGFLDMLAQFSQLLSASRWAWGELASPFALLRFFGVPHVPALAVHGAIALAAAAITARAWALKLEQRVPMLAAASLLMSPYLFTYDGLLLTVPLAWLLRHERGPSTLAVWLFSLLPLVSYFRPFPNTISLAAMLALWALHRAGNTARAYQV